MGMTRAWKMRVVRWGVNAGLFFMILILIGICTLGGYLHGLEMGKAEQYHTMSTLINERDYWEWKYGREKEDKAEAEAKARRGVRSDKKGNEVRIHGDSDKVLVGPPNAVDRAKNSTNPHESQGVR